MLPAASKPFWFAFKLIPRCESCSVDPPETVVFVGDGEGAPLPLCIPCFGFLYRQTQAGQWPIVDTMLHIKDEIVVKKIDGPPP